MGRIGRIVAWLGVRDRIPRAGVQALAAMAGLAIGTLCHDAPYGSTDWLFIRADGTTAVALMALVLASVGLACTLPLLLPRSTPAARWSTVPAIAVIAGFGAGSWLWWFVPALAASWLRSTTAVRFVAALVAVVLWSFGSVDLVGARDPIHGSGGEVIEALAVFYLPALLLAAEAVALRPGTPQAKTPLPSLPDSGDEERPAAQPPEPF